MKKIKSKNIVPIDGLTNEQYAQLISMLNLEKSHASAANFAGNAILLSNNELNGSWIHVPLTYDLLGKFHLFVRHCTSFRAK